MDVTLKRIDEGNFIDCFNLKLAEGQEAFVSHPIRSLAQAYVYYSQCIPFGIYFGDSMVGYLMVIYDYDAEEYNIWHMMIDVKHQNNGHGKAAMQRCLEFIGTKPFGISNRVVLTCNQANDRAIRFYGSLGFVPTGGRDEDEIEMALLM